MENFAKFPRTPHLFAMNESGLSDDIVMDKEDRKDFFSHKVTVEEKIDGSNIGFSFDKNSNKILAQNRSHYVTCQSHSQFKLLQTWIDEHSAALYNILCGEDGKSDFLLFGEWMYAKHSVFYDRLPGLFIAFDIYDRKKKKFLSVAQRNKILKGSGIPIIRSIAVDALYTNEDEYKKLLNTATLYCESTIPTTTATTTTTTTTTTPIPTTTTITTPNQKKEEKKKGKSVKKNNSSVLMENVNGGQAIEGIYIRIDEGPYLKKRAKVVRSDFIQTIESGDHWSGRDVVKNIIDFEWMYKIQNDV